MAEKPLSKKHQAFVNEYLRTFNATRAYMAIYPKASYESAMALSAKLLGDVRVSAVVADRLKEAHMSADAALKLTTDIANGDIAELMDVTSVGFNLDMAKAKEKGLTKLIKKVKQKTTTIIGKKEDSEDKEIIELEVELYSAQEAQRDILKMTGRLKDPGVTVYNVTLTDDE